MTAPLVYGSSRRPLPAHLVAGPKPAEVVTALRWLGLASEAYERDGRGSLWERLAEQVMLCPWCGSATWSRLHDLIYHVEVEADRLETGRLAAADPAAALYFREKLEKVLAPWRMSGDD